MEDKKEVLTEEKKIDFSYPEGMKKAAALLTFLPEEQREPLTLALASAILMF